MSGMRCLRLGLLLCFIYLACFTTLSAQDFAWKPVQGSDEVDYRWRYSVYCPEGSSDCAKEFQFRNHGKKRVNFDYAIYVEKDKAEMVQGGSTAVPGNQEAKVPLNDGLKVIRVEVSVHK